MRIERQQAAEAASLSRMGSRILKGVKLVVKWIMSQKGLGFTSDGNPVTVNVAWDNEEYMNDLTADEKIFFRMGIFAHELLHQVFTNFAYSNRICKSLTTAEAGIFMKFANTLEDPAIEYFAPNVMGGRLLRALKFSIARIYTLSPGIEESKEPFSQLLNALIHFGDCGLVKGTFTFPEAKECFAKIAPLYNKGITCPNSAERLDIAKECMEIARPLWEEYVRQEEAMQQLLEELSEFMKKSGAPEIDEDELEGDPDDSKADVRSKTLEKESGKTDETNNSEKSGAGETGEESDKETADGEGSGSPDQSDGDQPGESEKAADRQDADGESDSSDGQSGEGSADTEGKTQASSGSKKDGEAHGKGGTPDVSDDTSSTEDPQESVDSILEEDLNIDEEDMASIKRDLETEDAKLAKAESETGESDTDAIPNFDINTSGTKKSASCLNRRIRNNSSSMNEAYKDAVNRYKWDISVLTKALNKIFSADKEEDVRSTTGSYNIIRGAIGCTARIMDKKRDPAKKKDAAICLCVDLSGSMSGGGKIEQARKMSIVFAEALRATGIPHYIMGFHADIGADAVHDHFVTWNGKGRETLITMEADANNFDGYSIRYAANLLKNRPEANKVLIVISDGAPACYSYYGGNGYSDTAQAVKEAKRICNVQGIGLGSCGPELLQQFYGKDFIHCADQKLLTQTVSKKLIKIFK